MKISAKAPVIIAAAAALLVLFFAAARLSATRTAQAQLDRLESRASQMLRSSAETQTLRTKFPERADVASFVESMSVAAQRSGLRNLEITTLPAARSGGAGHARPGATPAPQLTFYPVKLTFEGDYRSVAEYLRRIQEGETYRRIVQLEMKPFKHTIKTSLIIEITAFEAAHAA
jgi:Tfp pilus assembly protein PilO